MIKGMSHVCQYVLDQDSAKAFYPEKLGFEVRDDSGNWFSLTQRLDGAA